MSYLQYAGMAAGGKVRRASHPNVVYRAGFAWQPSTMQTFDDSATNGNNDDKTTTTM